MPQPGLMLHPPRPTRSYVVNYVLLIAPALHALLQCAAGSGGVGWHPRPPHWHLARRAFTRAAAALSGEPITPPSGAAAASAAASFHCAATMSTASWQWGTMEEDWAQPAPHPSPFIVQPEK